VRPSSHSDWTGTKSPMIKTKMSAGIMRRLGHSLRVYFRHPGLLVWVTLIVMPVSWVHAAEWQLGVAKGAIGGQYSSMRFDEYGNAHICSFSPANGVLSYSFWDHAADKWFSTRIDKGGNFCSLALDSAQHPHISYLFNAGLHYAHWNGNSWEKQLIPVQAVVIGYNTSIALDSDGRPAISFYEEQGMSPDWHRLRMVFWNGKYWELRTADAAKGGGKFNSIAIDSSGRPVIAYAPVIYENASLRFARWNGHSWDIEIIEGAKGPAIMYSVGMALDKEDTPHIVYTDVANQLVKYAVKRNGKWTTEVIDALVKVGYPDRNGIALDDQGNVYLSYYDAGSGVLKLAYKRDGKWVREIVDENYAGFSSCVAVHNGSIWLTYADATGEILRYARRNLPAELSSPGLLPTANTKSEGETKE